MHFELLRLVARWLVSGWLKASPSSRLTRVKLALNSFWVDTFTCTLAWTFGLLRLTVHSVLGIVRVPPACNGCGHAH